MEYGNTEVFLSARQREALIQQYLGKSVKVKINKGNNIAAVKKSLPYVLNIPEEGLEIVLGVIGYLLNAAGYLGNNEYGYKGHYGKKYQISTYQGHSAGYPTALAVVGTV